MISRHLFPLMVWAAAMLAAFVILTVRVDAHEVRPAYLEVTERADGKLDVLWKQPSIGLLAVAIHPRIEGGLIERAPDRVENAENFELRRWNAVDLKGGSLDGREVRIDGLERTITDTLVLVHLKNGEEEQRVLTPAYPAFAINAHAGAAVPAYLKLGIEHILTGIDHLLFVFGLLLLSSGWKQLLRTITAFTIAHSITLALTALKLVSVNPQLIEAMVAYSILFLAVELVRKQRGKDGITQRSPWIVAFGFGLLHGAAFAGALKEIGLPEHNIPASLFLFNVGVEIGQLIFVAVVSALLWALSRLRWPVATSRLAWTAASYAIGSFATFWFLERLHTALDAIV
ncbi:HupE/UreJ family protein [Sphingobium sp. EM0848]|uniref:HupE/UreJ family protein n=1 Tax=Sphingobium sp. EM0848 TaxID=2743473 RepID=UPI001C3F78B6|nr:HupE/UreJ family protein [Sphingobium sp. EM0848]